MWRWNHANVTYYTGHRVTDRYPDALPVVEHSCCQLLAGLFVQPRVGDLGVVSFP